MKIRRFECPSCGFVHIFSPRESTKFKKRVVGFICPNCGYKVTDKDVTRKRGSGPKPPGERRKRNKNNQVKEFMPINIPTPEHDLLDTNIIEFRVNEPGYVPSSAAGHPGARINRINYSYHPPIREPPRRPTDRSLEEALLVGLNIVPSAEIPEVQPPADLEILESSYEEDCELEEMNEKKEAVEDLRGKLDQHQQRLSIIIERLDNFERTFTEKVHELETRNLQLETDLQTFSTLISQMESLLAHYERRKP